jgi:hypothetical protein
MMEPNESLDTVPDGGVEGVDQRATSQSNTAGHSS